MRGRDQPPSRASRGRDDPRKRLSFRPDIEGLRAVGLLAMLGFHAELGFAQGGFIGLDAFFVISGFLITRLLITELEHSGTINLGRFYAYRIKRLLPVAASVLIAIVVLSGLILPPTQNVRVGDDVLASAFYFVNWHLIGQQANYFAADYEASPVQHFWTLAVEEQFYILWPVLLLAFTWWWRRRGGSARKAALAGVSLIAIATFAYGVWYSFSEPAAAYFSTFTRSWAMALGGILALVTIPRLPGVVAAALGLAGIGSLVVGTVTVTELTPYPGVATLLPSLGAALIVIAGSATDGRAISSRVLAVRPLRYMGRISYSWYLWHWPPLVFVASYGPMSVATRVLIVLGSIVPAAITNKLIEEPFRRAPVLKRRPRLAFGLGASCMATASIAAVGLVLSQSTVPTLPADEVRGAAASDDQPTPQKKAERLRPAPEEAGDDRSRMQEEGCLVKLQDAEVKDCVFGDPEGKRTVVLYGDSLAMHYSPAVERLAQEHNWRLVGVTKAGCPPPDVVAFQHRLEREYHECTEWREKALERIEREDPDMILVSGRVTTPVIEDGEALSEDESLARMEEGYVRLLERLAGMNARVYVIKDLPPSPRNVPDCVSRSLDNLKACTFRPDRARQIAPDRKAVRRVAEVQMIDFTPVVCPKDVCRSVIGDALVFRDFDHLTPTFAATLAPMLERQLPGVG